jgi:2-hydroxychromene-2-carboxylate isomerase
MTEAPRPIRLPGEPEPPREPAEHHSHGPPEVVDEDVDLYGAEDAAARLAERLEHVTPAAARRAEDGRPLLSPPPSRSRDRIDGSPSGDAVLVVFGAHGTPSSRSLGHVLEQVRRRHPATVTVAWRHYPDPLAHPRASVLALAVEAAAARGRFWALTRELLGMRHDDPADLHGAMVRAGLDPATMLDAMRAGTGIDRIADDVASAMASGVTVSPTLFIDSERYHGDVEPGPVLDALDAVLPRTPGA